MSQNTPPPTGPDDLDPAFMDDDSSVLEATPAETYYGYDVSADESSLPLGRIIAGAILIVALLSGVIYLAYAKGLQDGQKNLPPLVMADQSPIKIMPDNNQVGDKFKNGDLNIYEKLQSPNPQIRTDKILDDAPGDGNVENLYSANSASDSASDSADADALEISFDGALPTEPEALIIEKDPELALLSPKPEVTKGAPQYSGQYIVQVSSTRNVKQAGDNFVSLTKRFPDLFENREPMIQKADLGDKGIFFRLGVSGFASREASKNFCVELKSRGQDCLVRKVD